MRKIFLENLPKNNEGRHKGCINWDKSKNKKCRFVYDDIEGYIKIIDKKGSIIIFEYNSEIFEMSDAGFARCCFGNILGKYTKNFKIETGSTFKNNKRDMVITDRKYKKDNHNADRKYYKYTCNNCGWDKGWIDEYSLLRGQGCSCCTNQTVVKGINDLNTTAPELVKYLVNKEDAYKYTKCSNKKVYVKCPDCGSIKKDKVRINDLYRHGFSCKKCGDNISYPNKFMYNILDQLNIDLIPEYSPEWLGRKRFDFYIPSLSLIIEMDGGLGHGKRELRKENNSLEIDEWKDTMANKNSIKVIRIPCDYNEDKFLYIKKSILNSELYKFISLYNVDWDKADKFATKSLVKEVCNYYENNKDKMSMGDICKNLKLNSLTVRKYLRKGYKFNWCTYNK